MATVTFQQLVWNKPIPQPARHPKSPHVLPCLLIGFYFSQRFMLSLNWWISVSRTAGMGYKSPVIQYSSSCSLPQLSGCLLAPKKNEWRVQRGVSRSKVDPHFLQGYLKKKSGDRILKKNIERILKKRSGERMFFVLRKASQSGTWEIWSSQQKLVWSAQLSWPFAPSTQKWN